MTVDHGAACTLPPPPENLSMPVRCGSGDQSGSAEADRLDVNVPRVISTADRSLVLQDANPEGTIRVVPVVLACQVGLTEAMILQQVHYWLQRSNTMHGGERWTYHTYDQWQDQFPFYSRDTIKRAIRKLERAVGKGEGGYPRGPLLISDKKRRGRGDHTKYYRIDYPELTRVIAAWPGNSDGLGSNDRCRLPQSRSGQNAPGEKGDLPHPCTKSTAKNIEQYAPSGFPSGGKVTSIHTAPVAPDGLPSRRHQKYTPPNYSTDPRLADAVGLLKEWRTWYRARRKSEGHPVVEPGDEPTHDPEYGAKETLWYQAFCRLLAADHLAATIREAFLRAMRLDYPYDWPNPVERNFARLANPHRKLLTWGHLELKKKEEALYGTREEQRAQKETWERDVRERARRDREALLESGDTLEF